MVGKSSVTSRHKASKPKQMTTLSKLAATCLAPKRHFTQSDKSSTTCKYNNIGRSAYSIQPKVREQRNRTFTCTIGLFSLHITENSNDLEADACAEGEVNHQLIIEPLAK
jgi:hypothetical protein